MNQLDGRSEDGHQYSIIGKKDFEGDQEKRISFASQASDASSSSREKIAQLRGSPEPGCYPGLAPCTQAYAHET